MRAKATIETNMPAIKKTETAEKFKKLQTEAYSQRDHNMCSVIAVAALTDRPYDEVAKLFLEAGRKHRKGTPTWITDRIIKQLGFKKVRIWLDDIIASYPLPHCNVLKNITSHHARRFPGCFPGGKLLARSRGHVFAIIDGEVHDWSVNAALRLVNLYRIVPIEAPVKSEAEEILEIFNKEQGVK